MIPEPKVDIDAAFEDGTLIDEGIREGVRQAIELHRRAGVPMVVWRDGRVQWISADEVATHDSEDDEPAISLGPIVP
jgi:hypothetical protein